ncbi:hypothetical protein IEQ34_004689 [Dendrobium chrysotoxum]|uniref:R13L1/DRL21-like LRR repeat region domain-containing protein n=1 Tax=Dendrobium chrysotoxum TaxID=161865 RepID=A0AAV7HFW4_DENCH|nr:hypothetical protein IEQ34_004689 [Dendrobium chrysotoxum]
MIFAFLGIYDLESVKDTEKARNAQLYEKRSLIDLTFCWGDTYWMYNINLEKNVLDELQPPKMFEEFKHKEILKELKSKLIGNDKCCAFSLLKELHVFELETSED